MVECQDESIPASVAVKTVCERYLNENGVRSLYVCCVSSFAFFFLRMR